MPLSQTSKYVIVGISTITIAVLVCLGVDYARNHPEIFTKPNYKPYQDSIKAYKVQISKLQFKEDSLTKLDNNLQAVKNKITQQYYEKIKHVKLASTAQLDSIITSEFGHH